MGLQHLVGYSVGGYLAAVFAERHPELVASALLLAPAIDNYERNFQDVPVEDWYMPEQYVAALQGDGLPPRPQINTRLVPTAVVHGMDDTDSGGSAPWRVEEWTALPWAAEAGQGCAVHMPTGVGHSLEPWLSSEEASTGGAPSLSAVLARLHAPPPPSTL